MSDTQWGPPPNYGKANRKTLWKMRIAELKEHPGEWGWWEVGSGNPWSRTDYLRRQYPEIEWQGHRVNGRSIIYGRFPVKG